MRVRGMLDQLPRTLFSCAAGWLIFGVGLVAEFFMLLSPF